MSGPDELHSMDNIDNTPVMKHLADVEETLSDAFNESSSPSHRTDEPLSGTDCKQNYQFCGRMLTTMSPDSNTKFSKELKSWESSLDSRSFITLALQTLSGREDVNTVLLVLCPSSKRGCHRIHIFCSGSQNHLGSAQVTIEEIDLLERHHSADNYAMVYCSLPITLKDVASNTMIKREIFDVARDQSQVSRHSSYQGKPLCISYKSSTSENFQSPIRTISPEDNTHDQDQREDDIKKKGKLEQTSSNSSHEEQVATDSAITETFAQKWLFLESRNKMTRLVIKERISQLRLVAKNIRLKQKLQRCRYESAPELSSQKLSKRNNSRQATTAVTADAQRDFRALKEQDEKKKQDWRAKSLGHLITAEAQKNTEEDRRSKQERGQKCLPEYPRRRLPSIRNSAMRQSKTHETQKNPAEDKRAKQEREEHNREQQRVSQRALHFSPTRSSLLRQQVAEEVARKNFAMRQKKIDELQKKMEEDRRKLQAALRQRKIDQTRRNQDADVRLKEESEREKRKQQDLIQRSLHYSPTRSSILRKRVADEAARKERAKEGPSTQERSQPVSPGSPRRLPSIRNSSMGLSKLQSVLCQPTMDDTPRDRDEDGRSKQEQRQESLLESPRPLASICHSAMLQSKIDELQKKKKNRRKLLTALCQCHTDETRRNQDADERSKQKREEHKRQQQELIERALHSSPTRSSVLRKRIAEEAARQKRDEEWRKEQERIKPTVHELPNQQDKQLKDTWGTGQNKNIQYSFVKVDAATLRNKKEVRRILQERAHRTLNKSPRALSGTYVVPTAGAKYYIQQGGAEANRWNQEKENRKKAKLLSITDLARDQVGIDLEKQSKRKQHQTRHFEPKWDDKELVTFLPPVTLIESVGHIPLPSMIPGIERKESVILASSESFLRISRSVQMPADFSPKACRYLKQKLSSLSVYRAFTKFGNLVDAINSNPSPLFEHLLAFFQFAEIIEFQMYARKERRFSDWSFAEEAKALRFRVDCYVFEDRRDYIASISLHFERLLQIKKLIPAVARNLHFIDDVYELTLVPRKIAKCLKMGLNAISAPSTIYPVLGEIIYLSQQPKATLVTLNSDPVEN